MKTKVGVIIPAFNEADSLPNVIRSLTKLPLELEILVIDDGSKDQTYEVARYLGVTCLSHPINCGVGAALITGLTHFTHLEYEKIIVVDADGQHPVGEIPNLLKGLETFDMVVGIRDWNEYPASKIRVRAHHLLRFLLRIKFGIEISDVTSGFRAISGNLARTVLPSLEDKYLEDTIMLLIQASRFGFEIGWHKVQIENRSIGKPSHNTLKSMLRYLSVILKILVEPRKG